MVILMRAMRRRSWGSGLGAVWLAGVLGIVGCGQRVPHGDRAWSQVHVTVTAGGRPVTLGDVTLLAKPDSAGVDAGGRLDAGGTTVIPALPGRYVAVILPLPPGPAEPGRAAGSGEPTIPPRYRSAATSPFDVEVRLGESNVFAFDMQPAAPAAR
jgi:antitoxin (DNA-binding transcriptional repressor) of toxin-antitoxin stability system